MPLDDWRGAGFPADQIEHDCALLFGSAIGQRGTVHDADVFRRGDHSDLAKFVIGVANRIEARAGSGDKRIGNAVQMLRAIATDMKSSGLQERDDHHWLIVSSLIKIINVLLVDAGK